MYFIIVSLLLFIVLAFLSLFILLQNGLYVNEFSVSNLQVKQLYIKWNKKIDLSVKEIYLSPSESTESNKPLDYNQINNLLKSLQYTTNWFESLLIEEVHFQDTVTSFSYKENSKGFLELHSPSQSLRASLRNTGANIEVDIKEFEDRVKEIHLDAKLFLDVNQQQLFGKVNAIINKDANLTLYTQLTTEQIYFKVLSHNDIKDIKYLIQLASLPEEIKFWTQDAIALESLTLESLRGTVEFKKLAEAYKNIYAKAKANKLIYTYNTQLDGIHTEYTDVEFKEGILYLYPRNSSSYNSNLGDSWLKIDFTTPQEILTLQLLFDGQLDEGMLEVLNAYKIKLPFLQHSGSMKTDLILAVNLISVDVDAHGTFTSKKANFDYLGLNIDIEDTRVILNNFEVTIDKMRAHYKDIATADVNVSYNAKDGIGDINFAFKSVTLNNIKLDTEKENLKASYHIAPNQDTITVAGSQWNIDDFKLFLEPMTMPFNLETVTLLIPTTLFSLENVSTGFIEGEVDIQKMEAKLKADILNLSYDGVTFSQSNTPFSITYNKEFNIVSPDDIYFNIAGTEYMLQKPQLRLNNESLTLKNTKLQMGRYVTTKVYAKHNFEKAKTHVSLTDFILKDYKTKNVLYDKNKILLSIEQKENKLEINSKELGAHFTSSEDEWKLYANSLALLATDSTLLKTFHIDKGNFLLYKRKEDKYVKFNAQINYPYKILTLNGVPTNNYDINGTLKGSLVALKINDNTTVRVDDVLKIKTKNAGINIHELIRAIDDIKAEQGFTNSKKSLELSYRGDNSYLYLSPDRKVISEYISLQYMNDILTAQLKHDKGSAGMRLEGKNFHIYGKGFNDSFMEKLFSLSKFKGGKLDFSLDGTTDEYEGIFYIKNSTIMDYKLLNNILAFINTVPSLVTFSLPGYSSNGLLAKEAYASFTAKNGVFKFSDIFLESQELNILGKGVADLKRDSIDINLNLKTDLGSDISKIPLVGYIFFDEESVSTTLKISGQLSNPQVKSQIAEDIVVAPLNIIKRTLTLPYNLLMNKEDNTSSKK
ncbi:MAG: AsmA-like C-terminal domain-containing protein [Campylobacterales bacterium]|nr:AsmA-like C-terminal domain-containing protein [Campylobacterales bacterium]